METAMLKNIAIALALAFAGLGGSATSTLAANPCIDCQNKCLEQIKLCEQTHTSQYCFDKYGEAYGACKVDCKGSPVCLGQSSCTPVKGSVGQGQTWHGAKCYSKFGCQCSALKCSTVPHYRNAKCFSPPG
jgi:hypothetical protein